LAGPCNDEPVLAEQQSHHPGLGRAAHLVGSLDYFDLLQPFSIQGLLNASTQPSFYPPLFHIASAGFYSLFGVSADSASLTNTIFPAVLLTAIYGIGEQMYDVATGLPAACLVSRFPNVFLMARFTDIEFSMLSLVALSAFLLLETDHFLKQGWSHALGISLGRGLLAKWVSIVFAGPPLLYIVLTSSVFGDLKTILKSRSPPWRQLALEAIIAVAGTSLLYLLGGDWLARKSYGLSLGVAYWATFFVLSCVSLLPSRPFGDLFGSVATALRVSAIWYVPNSDFISAALYRAFYIGSIECTTSQYGSSFYIVTLFRGIVTEHVSLAYGVDHGDPGRCLVQPQ
jgi:hypothetical protein